MVDKIQTTFFDSQAGDDVICGLWDSLNFDCWLSNVHDDVQQSSANSNLELSISR